MRRSGIEGGKQQQTRCCVLSPRRKTLKAAAAARPAIFLDCFDSNFNRSIV